MFEEGNEGRGHRDELLRGDIHVVDPFRIDVDEITLGAAGDGLGGEVAFVVNGSIGLGNDKLFFAIGYRVANASTFPAWTTGNEFKAIREKSLTGK